MSNIPTVAIQEEVQSLSPTALLEFFVVDTTKFEGGSVYRFHSGLTQGLKSIVWQGEEYQPMPVEGEGFDVTAQGSLPRPKLRFANVGGLFSALAIEMEDMLGAKVTRKRTFARYLDAVNFPQGNPEANPDQYLQDEIWYVDRKTTENKDVVEWELCSAFDLDGVQLPYRQIIKNSCPWKYRSPECGYTGSFFDENDQSVVSESKDTCPKRLSSCVARFGEGVPLPFGGFPGAQRGD